MPKFVIQDDVVIRAFQVILDPDTDPERQAAFADYYANGVADFEGWRKSIRDRFPNAFPATVVTAKTQDEFDAKLADADGAVVESMKFGAKQLAGAPKIKIINKFGTDARNIDVAACKARGDRRVAALGCCYWCCGGTYRCEGHVAAPLGVFLPLLYSY